MKRTIWELAAEAQVEVEKWPEWKRRAADTALVSPRPWRPSNPMENPHDLGIMTPKAAAAQERDRIVAYLRFCTDEYSIKGYQRLIDWIERKKHWSRWDESVGPDDNPEADDGGAMPPGSKDPWQ